MSMAVMAQADVWVWKNGVPVKTVQADSITFTNPIADVYHDGTEAGYYYVDLGLTSGTKWATCNVGAKKPQDYGNYYAWGEVATKETYSWGTYKYGTSSSTLTKYCYWSDYGKGGFTDEKMILDEMDDAAYVNLGGKWRMPTKDQQDELRNECYWVWTENYNNSKIAGYIVYKAKALSDQGDYVYSGEYALSSYSLNDPHIFLPAAGDDNGGQGHDGYYWSSSLSTGGPYYARYIRLGSGNVHSDYAGRSFGQSVRAVIPGE